MMYWFTDTTLASLVSDSLLKYYKLLTILLSSNLYHLSKKLFHFDLLATQFFDLLCENRTYQSNLFGCYHDFTEVMFAVFIIGHPPTSPHTHSLCVVCLFVFVLSRSNSATSPQTIQQDHCWSSMLAL